MQKIETFFQDGIMLSPLGTEKKDFPGLLIALEIPLALTAYYCTPQNCLKYGLKCVELLPEYFTPNTADSKIFAACKKADKLQIHFKGFDNVLFKVSISFFGSSSSGAFNSWSVYFNQDGTLNKEEWRQF
jgi:hypothetical protein